MAWKKAGQPISLKQPFEQKVANVVVGTTIPPLHRPGLTRLTIVDALFEVLDNSRYYEDHSFDAFYDNCIVGS